MFKFIVCVPSQGVFHSVTGHLGSAEVATLGCAAIADLARESSSNSVKVVHNDGLRTISLCMGSHPADPRVQAAAVHAVWMLCIASPFATRAAAAMEETLVPLITAAQESHFDADDTESGAKNMRVVLDLLSRLYQAELKEGSASTKVINAVSASDWCRVGLGLGEKRR